MAAQALAGIACPLTVLENHLRRQAGQEIYPGDVHRLLGAPADLLPGRAAGSSHSPTACSAWRCWRPSCSRRPAGPGGRRIGADARRSTGPPRKGGGLPSERPSLSPREMFRFLIMIQRVAEFASLLHGGTSMRKDLGLRMGLAALVVMIAPALATAETCLSPFVKRLDRPEKYLYLFCVDADAKDNDFIAVIDVDPDSADLRHDHVHARPGQPRGTRRTTGATPTTGRGSGRGACSRAGSGSSTSPPTRRGRGSRRCWTTCPGSPA